LNQKENGGGGGGLCLWILVFFFIVNQFSLRSQDQSFYWYKSKFQRFFI